jgi:hypothetical protein
MRRAAAWRRRTAGNLISAWLHGGRLGQLAIVGIAICLAMLRVVCHHDHFAA